MRILRSLLFIPAEKQRMLDKIEAIPADAFILDLEDSVSIQNKELARENILQKLSELAGSGKTIFIRVNYLGSQDAIKDVRDTAQSSLYGYMVPKFEDTAGLREFIRHLKAREKELEIQGKLKIILMIESSRGFLELRNIKLSQDEDLLERITGLALGGEDYQASLTISRDITKDMVELCPQRNNTFCQGP